MKHKLDEWYASNKNSKVTRELLDIMLAQRSDEANFVKFRHSDFFKNWEQTDESAKFFLGNRDLHFDSFCRGFAHATEAQKQSSKNTYNDEYLCEWGKKYHLI